MSPINGGYLDNGKMPIRETKGSLPPIIQIRIFGRLFEAKRTRAAGPCEEIFCILAIPCTPPRFRSVPSKILSYPTIELVK